MTTADGVRTCRVAHVLMWVRIASGLRTTRISLEKVLKVISDVPFLARPSTEISLSSLFTVHFSAWAGNLVDMLGQIAGVRSIPARAGNRMSPGEKSSGLRSIPAGEELGSWIAADAGRKVSQNAGRFLTHPDSGRRNVAEATGMGKGKHHRQRLGSIPARAGKPWRPRRPGGRRRVYPRAGGETRTVPGTCRLRRGLSPRGRGNLIREVEQHLRWRSIPARAGKPTRRKSVIGTPWVYPRAGGETRILYRAIRYRRGLSPRGRGNPREGAPQPGRMRSIPARAGKPRRHNGGCRRQWVYPRAGGETSKT